ncbi:cytochrome c [Salipiger sp. P9]|uniref:c-type cytochrome n=1 Tax=Salipiger pentaromativorans TaxID=2943193 RepID=UPI002157B8F1|nr:cytochrome c [Salipiger pentaromativorans]MCR8549247.1 cytochrome c [Salipiger pentaromativorans]
MKKLAISGAAVVAVAAGAIFLMTRSASQTQTPAAQAPAAGAPMVAVSLPDNLSAQAELGKRGFDAVCAACHGENAAGKDGFGPPLIHKIYEPSHHGDMAFFLAAERGVQAHHWRFGNMPAQKGLTRADMVSIVSYVRELQRANGIN